MEFPEPVISVAVEPKTKADQEKMGIALSKLAQEDPSFRVRTDEESGQTIISGMGELHLEIIVDRMRREFKVEANVGKPQVAYRETIRKAVEAGRQVCASVRWSRSVWSCADQARAAWSEAGLRIRQRHRWWCRAEGIHPAVDKGIRKSRCRMVLSPVIPMVDCKGQPVYDGSYHEVDSNEMAFKIAGSMGFKEGCAKASPVLLEPMMKVEVVTPEDYMGDVMGDLNRRRGILQGMEDSPSGKMINAHVPLSEMFGYSTDLRSQTQGRATYTMEFDHYAEAPNSVAEAVIKKTVLRSIR